MMRLRHVSVTREGWYYLAVLLLIFGGAMLREVNLLLMVAGILLGPVVYSVWAVRRSLRELRAERKLPGGVCAGDLLVVPLQVANPRRRGAAWSVVVEDRIRRVDQPDGAALLRPAVLFTHVAAGQSERGAYRARLTARGRYRFGPLRLSTRFPFGLLEWRVELGAEEVMTVYPRLGQLTRRWAARHREAFDSAHRRERRHGSAGEFYGVRAWHEGDPMRWIHWPTTARTGALSVRQFEQPRDREVVVLVDLWQPARPTRAQRDNVELAVSFAATILADFCRKGAGAVHLVALDGSGERIGGPASQPRLQEMMERLALAAPSAEPRTSELLECALDGIRGGAELVLVTTRPVPPDALALRGHCHYDSARRAALRHLRVVDASSGALDEYFRSR